ncbi:MAG: hypothetical protein QM690_05945 [Sphingobium sp.]
MSAGARLAAQEDETRERDVRLGMGLQLMRASNLTMTRLHLALQSGDRRLAMMAMDGLMDIDAEMEGFVADLAGVPDNDAHWQALSGYLAHQKAAIAAEKHVLIGVVGRPPPDASAVLEEFPAVPPSREPSAGEAAQEWEEEQSRRWPPGLLAMLLLCALALIGAGAAFGLGWMTLP